MNLPNRLGTGLLATGSYLLDDTTRRAVTSMTDQLAPFAETLGAAKRYPCVPPVGT